MSKQASRRDESRHFGQNLVVLAGGERYSVLNISSGGLSFHGIPFAKGDVVTLRIGHALEPGVTVEATCLITAIKKDVTHVTFTRVTMTLLGFIIDHMGTVLGVQPYYFGKMDNSSLG